MDTTDMNGRTAHDAHRMAHDVFAAVSTKWALRTLEYLGGGSKRFADVCRSVGPVSHKVMTENLRSLEHSGLITRTDYSVHRLHVEYALTPAGVDLLGLIYGMCDWSRAHLDDLIKSRAAVTGCAATDSAQGASDQPAPAPIST